MPQVNTVKTILISSTLMFSILGCSPKKNAIVLAYSSKWRKLSPTKQDSYYTEVILANQFDPLVKSDGNGIIKPLGAKSWAISNDHKSIKFNIDTSKKFSNGDNLKPIDYKKSWENNLRANLKSPNSSARGILYNVKGFDKFKQTGTIDGIKVTPTELVIYFKKPFRQILHELQGARFAAYKKVQNTFIGTGKYIINEVSNRELSLTKNKFNNGFKNRPLIKIVFVKTNDVVQKINSGEVDVHFSSKINSTAYRDAIATGLKIIRGQETSHATIGINGKNKRFFSNSNLRIALQYLVLKKFEKTKNNIYWQSKSFIPDNQIYLPLQSGRISQSLTKKYIDEGKKFLPLLISETQKHPITFFYNKNDEWLFGELKRVGIKFSKKSGLFSNQKTNILDEIYKNHDSDMFSIGFSVNNGDPDGIYHLLGANGVITSPVFHRSTLLNLLENGRKILDIRKLDEHYRLVTESVFKEVPLIHFGFKTFIVIYNSKKISLNKDIMNRNSSHLDAFTVK